MKYMDSLYNRKSLLKKWLKEENKPKFATNSWKKELEKIEMAIKILE